MTMAAREPRGTIQAAPMLVVVTGAAAMAAAIGVEAAAVIRVAVETAEVGDPISPKVLRRRYTLRGHE
jgi:hypothetical protein